MVAVMGGLGLLLVGCGMGGPRGGDASGPSAPGSVSAVPAPPPDPRRDPSAQGPSLEPVSPPGSAFSTYSQDPLILRHQVATRCAAARDYEEPDPLPALVEDLSLSAVDPASAAEALILGGCGSLEAVVRELVAQGGYLVVGPVSSRASALGGAGAQHRIEAAVAAGLDHVRGTPDASLDRPGQAPATYGMAHVSPRSLSAVLAGADALNSLYENATPGFGLYTFVLLSAGSGAQGAAQQARARELLRVIETYVPGDQAGGPARDVHAFLVAVHPERADLPLAEQTGPELSDPMRRQLAGELRGAGLASLARRLETRPGPFLVSSPEPRLLGGGANPTRLIVDLSRVGSEYLYAVVDAFDQPVPSDPTAGLDAVRDRLILLPVGPDGSRAAGADWVFRAGGTAPRRVAR